MKNPKGLFISLAILADNLLKPIPTEQVKLVNSFILCLNFIAKAFLFSGFIISVKSIYPSSVAINSTLFVIFKIRLWISLEILIYRNYNKFRAK